MEAISEVIRPVLKDRPTRFVFPSEICAEAWLAESLGMGAGALEADRFLGWDRLKEAAARIEGRLASDDYLRRIFAASLLARNAEAPFLSSIVPRAYANLWQPFAGYVATRLPALGRLPGALGAAGKAAMEDPAAADWLAVRERYEDFLRGIGRFEPSYEPRVLRALPGRTVIFFPELIEDFEEYRAALDVGASVRLVGLPSERTSVPLRRPETALAELRETLAEVGALLDSGLEAERIAITVAGLDRYRPYLEREAALLSVPLAVRSGSSLAATSGGRLFVALRGAYSSGFSYDALRDLLLSPAWPWKDGELGGRIMAEGRRLHAVAPWPAGGKTVDAWEASLRGDLLSSYRRLKRRVSDIVGAPDFKSLLRSYNVFKAEFLSREPGDWDEGANLSLARCVVELEGLARAQAQSGLEVSGAFGLYLRALEAKPYVSSSAAGLAGVPVYEWRVAAGIFPERHFVLGASQDALAVPARGFDFLGEALRKELRRSLYQDPEAADRDAAPSFISAYALSGASVSFSCPQAGFGGDAAAHGFLVSMSKEEAGGARDPAYVEEVSWLSGRGPAPSRLHRIQALGLRAAAAAPSAPPSAPPGEGAFLEAGTAALARRRLYREGEARAGFDATAIDYYLSCPYAYLYLRLLAAGPEPSGIEFVDNLFMGDVYHEALALLFERIREEDGRFRGERTAAYMDFVGDCLDRAFARLAERRGPFVGAVLEIYRGRLEPYLRNLVAEEAERFPSLEVGPVEEELELDYPDLAGGVVLRGRIDRISLSEAGAVIVDYKKGSLPAKSQVAPDGAGAIAKAQIPCYLRLVLANSAKGEAIGGSCGASAGAGIDSAWYLSIEGDGRRKAGSAACAFDGSRGEKSAYVPKEGLEPLLKAFDEALRETAQGVFAGAFPLAPKEAQKAACADCGARGICRERYALRFGGRA